MISVCNVGTLHNSRLTYDMDASSHNDGDIEDCTHQDGEHRIMSMHISGFDLVIDSMTAKHIILNLENNDMYAHCKAKNHVNNTHCDRVMFECSKRIGIGNGMYKYPFVNTEYNSLAIRVSSRIVLITRYMHTTLHQLESNDEHKIVCSRLDGRGVTNVEHLHTLWYASNLSELKRYL